MRKKKFLEFKLADNDKIEHVLPLSFVTTYSLSWICKLPRVTYTLN